VRADPPPAAYILLAIRPPPGSYGFLHPFRLNVVARSRHRAGGQLGDNSTDLNGPAPDLNGIATL